MSLHDAARRGDVTQVWDFLDRGAHIDAKDTDGNTSLHCAAINGHLLVVKLLLEKGADTEVKETDGNTPLTCAASQGHLPVVQLLLEKGAAIEATNNYGLTAADVAEGLGKRDVDDFLCSWRQERTTTVALPIEAPEAAAQPIPSVQKQDSRTQRATQPLPPQDGTPPSAPAADLRQQQQLW